MNNLTLIIVLSFVLILIILFWIMPDKKGKSVARNIKTLWSIFPLVKMFEALISYFNSKKLDKR